MHADCLFADYGPQSTPVQIKGPLATAAFLRTTFTSTGLRADNLPPAPIVAAVDGAHVKMEDCTFEVAPGRQSAILYVRLLSLLPPRGVPAALSILDLHRPAHNRN